MKITLSKSKWKQIGQKQGWIKHAMPPPQPSKDEQKEMIEQGIDVIPYTPRAKHNKEITPNIKKRELIEVVKDDTFKGLDPKTIIQLPSIAKLDENKLIEIDNEIFYLVNVITPTTKIPGEFILLNPTTGNLKRIPYTNENIQKMQPPKHIKQNIVEKINQEINNYNKKIEQINKYTGITKLNLQIKSTEEAIEERIQIIKNMKQATENKMNQPTPQPYADWTTRIMKEVQEGKHSLVDAFHTIIFMYQDNMQKLINDINNNKINIPEEIKPALINIANRELTNKQKNEDAKKLKQKQKEENMEEEMEDYQGIQETPMQTIDESYIPGGKFEKLPAYSDYESLNQQYYRIIESIEKNQKLLERTQNSMQNLRTYITQMETGTRSIEQAKQNPKIQQKIKNHLNDIKVFIKAYEIDIIQNGKINPKLMGTSGRTIGNAFIAIKLQGIINTIYNTILQITPNEIEQDSIKEQIQDEIIENTKDETTANTFNMKTVLTNELKKQLKKYNENI